MAKPSPRPSLAEELLILDRAAKWHRVMTLYMCPALSVLILAFFALSLPVGIRGEVLADRPHCSQAATAETAAGTIQVDPAAGPSAWHHPMKGVAKRGKGTFSFVSVPLLCITDPDPPPLAHARPSALAAVHQAAPLYQTLQVLRF